MNRSLRILNVEDSPQDEALLKRHLAKGGYDLTWQRVDTPEEMQKALDMNEWDAVLCDYAMPHFDALKALALLRQTGIDIPFIIISGTVEEDIAVQAMLTGAHDYLSKDNLTRLVPAIERELEQAKNRHRQREVEAALRASESELRALFAAMTDVIFVLGADGYFRKIAPTDPAFLYKPAQDLIGKSLQEVFTKEQSEFFLDHIRRALNDGRMHTVEYSLQIDEVEVWFNGSVSPMSDDSVLWIGRDITQRKRAEDSLRKSEETFASAFEMAPIGVALVLPNGRWLKVNRALCDLVGYTEAEFLDLSFQDITHTDDLEEDLRKMDLLLSRQIPNYQMEKRYVHKQGHLVFVDLHVSLVRYDNGEPKYFISQIQDITERKASDHQLQLHSLLLNSIGQAVIVTDPAGIITYWNDQAESMYGWTSSEVIGQSVIDVTPTTTTRRQGSEILRSLKGGKSWSGEFVVQNRRGTSFPVFVTNTPLMNSAGTLDSIIGVSHDVTERKQAEEKLRENESLLLSTQRIAHIGSWVMVLPKTADGKNGERWSDEHYRIFGFEPGEVELTDEVFYRSVHPDDRERVAKTVYDAIEQTKPFDIEHRIILPDGRERTVQAIAEVILDEETGVPLKLLGSVQDITERKRAEEALRESETRLRTIIETEPECVKLINADGTIAAMNAAGLRMIGADSFDDVVGRSILDLVAEQHREAYRELIDRVFLGETGTLEFQILGLTGELAWADIHASPMRAANGEITALLGITRDVTESKRATEALRESDEKFHQLADNINDVFWIRSPDMSKIYYISPAYEKIWGRPLRSDYADPGEWNDLIVPDDRQRVKAAYASLMGDAANIEVEFRIVRPDNELRWVRARGFQVRDPEGILIRLAGIVTDITESKHAVGALAESEERNRELVENAIDIIYTHDLEGNYTFVNQAGERITGYTTEETLAMNMADTVAPEYLEQTRQMMAEKLAGNDTTAYEVELIGKDKQRITLEVNTRLTYENGVATGVQGIARDITERKRTEAALEESEASFKALFDTASDAIFVTKEGALKACNPAAEKLFGCTQEDMLARRFATDFSPLRQPDGRLSSEKRAEYSAAAIIGEPQFFEWTHTHLDGTPFDAEVHLARVDVGGVTQLQATVRDITERKLAETRLAELTERTEKRERMLTTMLSSMSDFAQIYDSDGRILFVNQPVLDLWGMTLDAVIGKDFHELDYPTDLAAKLLEQIKQVYRTKKPITDETPFVGADGTLGFYEYIFSPAMVRDGEVDFVVGSTRDVTERRWAQSLLAESQQRLSLAAESANIGIWDWDVGEDSIKWDARMYELYGNYDEDFSGPWQSWNLNHHPDDNERVYEELAAAFKGPGDFHSEFRVVWPNGEVRHLESSAKVLRDQNGRALRFIGVNWDITERKIAEATLRESDQRAIRDYGLLLTRVAKLALALGDARDLDAVYAELCDFALVSTGMDGLVISLLDAKNKTRSAAYVWSEGNKVDAPSLPPMEMSNSPHTRSVLTGEIIITDDFQNAMESQPVLHIGGDLPQSSLVVPMSVMGKIVGGVEVQSNHRAAFTDNHATAMQMAANLAANAIDNVRLIENDREQAEQLRQAQKMEAVGVLAGGIAHDFNNLLTAINGYSDLTLRKIPANDPLRRNIEEIKKAGDRAAELTGQLLAFSRKKVLKPVVHNLNSVIETIEKMLRRIIRENIDLRTVLDPDLGNILADPGQIEQVIMNLSVNARDAMPDGGTLTIETQNVYLDEEYISHKLAIKPGPFARMTISDTGVGMDASTQQHIFEPFFTTKEVGKGTGLGLAMVYGIVKQSGGDILVYSELGHGTTFKIYFPHVYKSVEKRKWVGERDSAARGTETVLLVEDEEIVRNLVREILTENGYKVLEAASGKTALSICEAYVEPIHLLLTDVIMPKMGGAELKKRVVDLVPEIRVLFISGYTDDSIAERGIDDPDVAFLEKPFTPDSLIRKVRDVLDTAY